jgi:hypothetical protein
MDQIADDLSPLREPSLKRPCRTPDETLHSLKARRRHALQAGDALLASRIDRRIALRLSRPQPGEDGS